MIQEFAEKTAVVTGASEGIGRATAADLAAAGAQVVAIARRRDRLEELADEVAAQGNPRPVLITADLYEASEVRRAATECLTVSGRVDVVVNNAGGSIPVDAYGDTGALWAREMQLQFDTPRLLTEAFLPGMEAAGWGRVINIGGTKEPQDFVNISTVAKAAILAWGKALSRQMGRAGITVNTIIPGMVLTGQVGRRFNDDQRRTVTETQIPVGRFGAPEEVASLISYLISDKGSFINGAVLEIDGGLHRYAF